MSATGSGSDTGHDERNDAGLRHEGVPCAGSDVLVSNACDLVTDALGRDDACLVLAPSPRASAIRSRLGAHNSRVSFFDLSVQGRNPARMLPGIQAFADSNPDRRLQIVAEPVHHEQSTASRAEVELGELILGVGTYRSWPASVWCLYDEDAFAAGELDSFTACHQGDADPAAAERRLRAGFAAALPPAPVSARRVVGDRTTLSELRRAVAGFADDRGLDAERIDDFVYAVNEVVTNSICHGEGRARVLLWADAASVVCEVFDRGHIDDPLAGRIAPRAGQTSGRGLWLVNQLCDLVQVRSASTGTSVRMSVDF